MGAQGQSRKKRSGPRAIAVVRWQADVKDRAVPTLIPVTILDDGRFHDASIYKAAPSPMPLLVGTVYEAQDKGEVLGYFTIKNQARTRDKESWVALGDWQSASPKMDEKFETRPQSAEIVRDRPDTTTGVNPGDNSDDRDLRKKSTTVYDENGKEMPAGTPASPADPMGNPNRPDVKVSSGSSSQTADSAPAKGKSPAADPNRPTMKRQSGSAPQQTTAKSAPQDTDNASPVQASDDPDRPRLKHGKPTELPTADPTAKTASDDPNRPVMRHGSSSAQISGKGKNAGIPVPPRVLARGPLIGEGTSSEGPALLRTRTYEAVAVSDATPEMAQTFHYKMPSDEKEAFAAKLSALAQKEVDAFLKSIGRGASGKPASQSRVANTRRKGALTAATAAPPLFAESQMEVLDLTHSNDPVLVFSGRERIGEQASQEVYVTFVARVDLLGNPRKLFSSVTSADRLDVMPKLQLIDAVDANGDGFGELLFRRVADDGAEFAIYNVGMDKLSEVFHGGVAD